MISLCLGQAVGNTLYALGRLGIYQESLTDRMRIAVEVAIRKSFDRMHRKDVLQTVHGLAMMGFQWRALTPRTRECIAIAIFKQVNEWAEDAPTAIRDVALLLHSLQFMGVGWAELPSGVRSACLVGIQCTFDFEKRFDRTHGRQLYGAARRATKVPRGKMEGKVAPVRSDDEFAVMMISLGQSAATILYSLARMDADINGLPKEARDSLILSAQVFSGYMSPQGLAMAYYGLGRLGVKWSSLPSSVGLTLTEAITDAQLDGLSLSQVVWGLSLMGAHWTDLPLAAQSHLIAELEGCATSLRGQMLSVLLRGLSAMGLSVQSDVSTGTKKMLRKLFGILMHTMADREFVLALKSLGTMKFHWREIDPFEALDERLRGLNVNSLVSLLQGLCELRCQGAEIPEPTRRLIFENIALNRLRIQASDVANMFYSLGKLEMNFLVLEHHERGVLVRLAEEHIIAMEPYQITLFLIGISRMKVPWSLLPSGMQAMIESNLIHTAATFDARTLLSVLSAISHLHCNDLNVWKSLIHRLDELQASLSLEDAYTAILSLNRCQIDSEAVSDIVGSLTDRVFARESEPFPNADVTVVEGISLTEFPLHKKLTIISEATKHRSAVRLAVERYFEAPRLPPITEAMPVLRGLIHLQMDASQFSSKFRKAVLEILVQKVNSDGYPRFDLEPLVVLHDLGIGMDEVPSHLNELFLNSLFSKNYDIDEIDRLITSYPFRWSALSSESKRSILYYLKRRSASSVGTSSIIITSASILLRMGATWEDLPTRPRNQLASLLGNIFEEDHHHASAVVSFLLQMKCKWRMLPKELRHRIIEHPDNWVFPIGKDMFLQCVEG